MRTQFETNLLHAADRAACSTRDVLDRADGKYAQQIARAVLRLRALLGR